MSVETLTDKAPDELDVTLPAATDNRSEGDDHLRLLKDVIKTTFANVSGPVTATHTELNKLDGVTSSTAELNILDGVTATAAEINKLDGLVANTTELDYNNISILGTWQANKTLTSGASSMDCNNINMLNVDIDTGTIAGAVTGVTQSPGDNSTKLATTAYVDTAATGTSAVAWAIGDGTSHVAGDNLTFSRITTGHYRFTFGSALASANYAVVSNCDKVNTTEAGICMIVTRTTTYFDVQTAQINTTTALREVAGYISATVFI